MNTERLEEMSGEELAEALKTAETDVGRDADSERVVHDLHVYQIELEMQNRELREAQAELLAANARYLDLYEFAPVAYCTLDREERIQEANLTAAALFGLERGSLIARRLSSIVPREDRKQLRDHLKRCFEEGAEDALDLTLAFRDGEPVMVRLVSKPVLDEAATVIACRVTLTDISALKRSEQMLGFLARASAVLASSLRDSDAVEEVADLLVPSFADLCLVDLIEPGDGVRRIGAGSGVSNRPDAVGAHAAPLLQRRVIEGGTPIFIPDVAVHGTPELKLDPLLAATTSVICAPVASRGRTRGVLTLAMAASGRRYLPGDLAFAQDLGSRIGAAVESAGLYRDAQRAIQAREQTLAVVSHDLRSPVSAVLLAVRALEETNDPSEPIAGKLIQSIERGVESMSRMIDDLLDLSSIDAGRLALTLRECQVDRLLGDACDNLAAMAREKRLELKAERAEQRLKVRCDRERVLQVFSNLVGNAIKFTPAGGSISLAAQPDESLVKFTVRDTGPGIDRALLPHLFERYSQAAATARRGRGLGLYICKGIVEAHGGRIWADTGAKRGTSIVFTLLRATSARETAGHRALRRAAPVLVVDDDPQHRDGLRAVLTAGGYAVEEAQDGAEALEKVRSGGPLPALILLDLQMPRMDGRALMSELKKDARLASIPVLLVSGYAKLGAEAETMGARGYLRKPVRAEQLLQAVGRWQQRGTAG